MKNLVKKLLEMLMDKQILMLIAAVVVFVIIIAILYFIFRKRKHQEWDDMEGHEFEHFCADLLRRRGFKEVIVTKGSGDFGIDILAERDGISYGIQCKNYSAPIGVKAVQEVYAGRDYYDCMVGVVMSNQYFTGPAVEAAKKLKIVLWDRGYIEEMLEEVDEVVE
jgi:restriction system protein